MMLALLFLVVLLIPVVHPDQPSAAHLTLAVLNVLIWAVLALDYLVRLYLARARWRFARGNVLDLVVIVVPMLRPLRVLRSVRAVRLLRLARLGALAGRTGHTAQRSLHARATAYVAGSGTLLLFIAAAGMVGAERSNPDANIKTFGDALWWAMTTVTMVGYGDRYPVTAEGRSVATFLMVVGIALLGFLTRPWPPGSSASSPRLANSSPMQSAQRPRRSCPPSLNSVSAGSRRPPGVLPGPDALGAGRGAERPGGGGVTAPEPAAPDQAGAEMPVFSWSTASRAVYATRRQLAADRLAPGGPAIAVLRWRDGRRVAYLYARAEAKPKRAITAGQVAALGRAMAARRTCPRCRLDVGYYVPMVRLGCCVDCHRKATLTEAQRTDEERWLVDREHAAAWAAALLDRDDVVILDTETTGFGGYLVEVAALTTTGRVLLDTLVRPGAPIAPAATRVHGITDATVAASPTFGRLYDHLAAVLFARTTLAYNAPFDRGVLARELDRHHQHRTPVMPEPSRADPHPDTAAWLARTTFADVMRPYAAYVGARQPRGGYRPQRLTGGDHSALGDCRAVLRVLREMAAGHTGAAGLRVAESGRDGPGEVAA